MPDLFVAWFPDSGSVYTLDEIATRAGKNMEQAREAQHTLSERVATRDLVQPLDNRRPAHYSPAGARLIARHILRGEERNAARAALREEYDHRIADLLEATAANTLAIMELIEKVDELVSLLISFRKKS